MVCGGHWRFLSFYVHFTFSDFAARTVLTVVKDGVAISKAVASLVPTIGIETTVVFKSEAETFTFSLSAGEGDGVVWRVGTGRVGGGSSGSARVGGGGCASGAAAARQGGGGCASVGGGCASRGRRLRVTGEFC